MKRKIIRKSVSCLLIAAMCISLSINMNTKAEDINEDGRQQEQTVQAEGNEQIPKMRQSSSGISAPKIEPDSSMVTEQRVTWDCVWFGNYPQAEVVPSARNYTALDKKLLRTGDLIEDEGLYDTLKNLQESQWNSNGDATVNASKYRRIKKSDAIYTNTDSGYYNWTDSDTYHYFKYEPVKWRVLKVHGNQAFLLSDIALDDQCYNTKYERMTWETGARLMR